MVKSVLTWDYWDQGPLLCQFRVAVAAVISRYYSHPPRSEPYDYGYARRRPCGAEADHRPNPRPLAHAAQLGRLEAALRVEGPHRARTGLAGTRGNGGGGSPEYLQVRATRDQGDHRPLRRDHPRSRRPSYHHGPLVRRPYHAAPAGPRARRLGRSDQPGADQRRVHPAPRPGQGCVGGAEEPGQPPPDPDANAGGVPLRFHQHAHPGGVEADLRQARGAGARTRALPGGVRELHTPRGDDGQPAPLKPRAAVVPGQRQGPHRARSGHARRLQHPAEDGRAHRAQGVPRPLPLHVRPGRLGTGGGLLARLGRAQRADLTPRWADWRSFSEQAEPGIAEQDTLAWRSTCLQSDVYASRSSADLARQLSVSSREIPLPTSVNGTVM